MLQVFKGNRPDITPAQIVSGVPILAALLNAFGVYSLSPEQQDALQTTGIWALGILGADAAIRIGRNVSDIKSNAVVAEAATGGVSDPEVDELHPDDVEDVSPVDLPTEALGKDTDNDDVPPVLEGESAGSIGQSAGSPPLRPE